MDTNVVVSALYDPDSPPGRIVDAAFSRRILLCAPESVRDELGRTLAEVLGYTVSELQETIGSLPIEWVEESIYRDEIPEAARVLRDPDDVPILACGFATGCDIVSGDKDLHAAKQRKVRIWKPSELVRR